MRWSLPSSKCISRISSSLKKGPIPITITLSKHSTSSMPTRRWPWTPGSRSQLTFRPWSHEVPRGAATKRRLFRSPPTLISTKRHLRLGTNFRNWSSKNRKRQRGRLLYLGASISHGLRMWMGMLIKRPCSRYNIRQRMLVRLLRRCLPRIAISLKRWAQSTSHLRTITR